MDLSQRGFSLSLAAFFLSGVCLSLLLFGWQSLVCIAGVAPTVAVVVTTHDNRLREYRIADPASGWHLSLPRDLGEPGGIVFLRLRHPESGMQSKYGPLFGQRLADTLRVPVEQRYVEAEAGRFRPAGTSG